MDGIILLNKPPGMTSHDCVARMRRISGIRKIGHTGTLDPQATGLLLLCLGQATRIIPYLEEDDKVYVCRVTFGVRSDTYDIWGAIEEKSREEAYGLENLSQGKIQSALEAFRGEIMQKPPLFSAIRVDGKRLYQYAREGKQVEVPERKVTIHDIQMMEYRDSEKEALLRIHCSKGTYVRSICHDLGNALGCGGVMSGLVRMACGAMRLENAVTFEELTSMEDVIKNITPMEKPLVRLGKIQGKISMRKALEDGKSVDVLPLEISPPEVETDKPVKYRMMLEEELAAIGSIQKGLFYPERVFKKKESDILES